MKTAIDKGPKVYYIESSHVAFTEEMRLICETLVDTLLMAQSVTELAFALMLDA